MQPHNEPVGAPSITGTRDAVEAPQGAVEGREEATGGYGDPLSELFAAAFQLRNPFHLPGLKVGIDPELAQPLADLLEHTAATAKIGRIHGTSLIICDPCCQQLPCDHLRPALAVARQINGTEATA